MAVNSNSAPPRLGCGREPAKVWEHAAAGRLDRHEASCPHCQTTVADQASLQAGIRELIDEPIELPPSLLDQVMAVVRVELRRDYLPLPTRYGTARLQQRSAAAVLRHAVDQMSGIRARSCRISPATDAYHDRPPGTAPPRDTAWRVQMSVAVQLGTNLPSSAARARQMILRAADQLLGLPIDQVDIDVIDVFAATSPDSSGGDHRGAPRHPSPTPQLGPGRLEVAATQPTAVRVGATAVANIAAHYTRQIPGVAALQPDLPQYVINVARRLLGPDRDYPDGIEVDFDTDAHGALVTISAVAQQGFNCRNLAEAIQQQVAARVHSHTGLKARVAVTITDIDLHEVRPSS